MHFRTIWRNGILIYSINSFISQPSFSFLFEIWVNPPFHFVSHNSFLFISTTKVNSPFHNPHKPYMGTFFSLLCWNSFILERLVLIQLTWCGTSWTELKHWTIWLAQIPRCLVVNGSFRGQNEKTVFLSERNPWIGAIMFFLEGTLQWSVM